MLLLLKPSTPSHPLLGVLGPINTANVLTSLLLLGPAAVTRLSLTAGIYYFFPCFSFHKQPTLILLPFTTMQICIIHLQQIFKI